MKAEIPNIQGKEAQEGTPGLGRALRREFLIPVIYKAPSYPDGRRGSRVALRHRQAASAGQSILEQGRRKP